MDNIQLCMKGIIAAILAYLAPIDGSLTALVVVLTANMVIGIAVGVGVEGEKFQFKKAFRAILESSVIAVLIAAIYFIGEKNGDQSESIRVTSYAVYIAVVIYGQNIVKNLLIVWPDNRFLLVLNYFLSAEFMRVLSKIKSRGKGENNYERYNDNQDYGRYQ